MPHKGACLCAQTTIALAFPDMRCSSSSSSPPPWLLLLLPLPSMSYIVLVNEAGADASQTTRHRAAHPVNRCFALQKDVTTRDRGASGGVRRQHRVCRDPRCSFSPLSLSPSLSASRSSMHPFGTSYLSAVARAICATSPRVLRRGEGPLGYVQHSRVCEDFDLELSSK